MSIRPLTKAQRANVRRTRRIVRFYRKQGGVAKFHPGWKRRGGETLRPEGCLDHDDVSAKGESLGILPLLIRGRSDLAGPLYNFWTSKGGSLLNRRTGRRSVPTLHIIAAGVANHAGTGYWDPKWPGGAAGNSTLLGHCADNRAGEPMPKAQRVAIDRFHVAVMLSEGWAKGRFRGHKEWTNRKSDPSYSMPKARRRAAKKRAALVKNKRWARLRWRKVR